MLRQMTTLPADAFPDLGLRDGDRLFATFEKGQATVTILKREAAASKGAIAQFIRNWKGAFSLPEVDADADPRLADLIRKHVR